jgi:hypothetical protein
MLLRAGSIQVALNPVRSLRREEDKGKMFGDPRVV